MHRSSISIHSATKFLIAFLLLVTAAWFLVHSHRLHGSVQLVLQRQNTQAPHRVIVGCDKVPPARAQHVKPGALMTVSEDPLARLPFMFPRTAESDEASIGPSLRCPSNQSKETSLFQ
jgi:hypothetical protein